MRFAGDLKHFVLIRLLIIKKFAERKSLKNVKEKKH